MRNEFKEIAELSKKHKRLQTLTCDPPMFSIAGRVHFRRKPSNVVPYYKRVNTRCDTCIMILFRRMCMDWINLIVALITGTLGGSLFNYFSEKKKMENSANYDRKLNRYYHITAIIELFLNTEESKYSINMSMWDTSNTSLEENKKKAWNDLRINKRQLLLITNDKSVHRTYDEFLDNPDANTYEKLLLAMKKDLWR